KQQRHLSPSKAKALYIFNVCYREKTLQIRTGSVFALIAALALGGCVTMSDTQRNTALGVGIGALAGAGVAKATGGKAGKGALMGAAVGGVGTYIWSANMERQRQELEAATRGTGVDIIRTSDNQLMLAIPSDVSFDSS